MTTDNDGTKADSANNDTGTKKEDSIPIPFLRVFTVTLLFGSRAANESFFRKFRDLRDSSAGVLEFLLGFIVLISGTVGYAVFLVVLPILPVIGLIIGFVHKDHCIVDERIPIWLIVWSISNLVRQFFILVVKQLSEEIQNSKWLKPIHLLDIFIIIWFFVGNFWVYGKYKPEYDDPFSNQYCHETVYVFSFVVITLIYVLVLILLLVAIATVILCACVFAKTVHVVESTVEEIEAERAAAELQKKEAHV